MVDDKKSAGGRRDASLEEEIPLSLRDEELDPVSLQEIEMILAPGRAPRKLSEPTTAPQSRPPPLPASSPAAPPHLEEKPARRRPSPPRPDARRKDASSTARAPSTARSLAAPPPDAVLTGTDASVVAGPDRTGASGSPPTLLLVVGSIALLGIGFAIGRVTAESAPMPGAILAAPTGSAVATAVPPSADAPPPVAPGSTRAEVETLQQPATAPAGSVPGGLAAPPSAGALASGAPAATATESSPQAVSPFNKDAANAALAVALGQASACKQPGDPSGVAQVTVTFAPSGRVTAANLDGPPFQGTSTGSCIAKTLRGTTIPEFSGDPTTVTKRVSIP